MTLGELAELEKLLPLFAQHCQTYTRLLALSQITVVPPRNADIIPAADTATTALAIVAGSIVEGSESSDLLLSRVHSWSPLTRSDEEGALLQTVPLDLADCVALAASRLLTLLRDDIHGAHIAASDDSTAVVHEALVSRALLRHHNGAALLLQAHAACAVGLGNCAVDAAPSLLRDYCLGRALIACGQVNEGCAQFEAVAAAITGLRAREASSSLQAGAESASLQRQVLLLSEIGDFVGVGSGALALAALYRHFQQLLEAQLPSSLFAAPEAAKPVLFRRHAAAYKVLHMVEAALSELRLAQQAAEQGQGGAVPPHLLVALGTTLFKYALNLGLTDQAFSAAIALHDPETRKDCVQRLGEWEGEEKKDIDYNACVFLHKWSCCASEAMHRRWSSCRTVICRRTSRPRCVLE